MANPFVHVELQTTDLKKARDFYSRLFDWKLEDTPMPGFGTYTMIGVGEGTGGGMMAAQSPGAPSHWLAYVDVSDLASATRKAKDLGAQVVVDSMPVADMGKFSIIQDPTGAHLGLWQSTRK
ncbi:MAG TPA: VOC family protein [Myxococcaceae bacterium]|nr:VOC family protein [Myxococcaceae bacterium]